MDKYKNYSELERHEEEGKDYIIRYRYTDSKIALMAPHGGGIEPGTIDLADEIAGKDFLFYSFSGIKEKGNGVLHLSSTRFDEPAALEIAGRANTVITIHGCRNSGDIIYTGGKNHKLRRAVSAGLANAGFNIKNSQHRELKGKSDYNICNRCGSGKGVQLEISIGLRQKMFDSGDCFSGAEKTPTFYEFVGTLRELLLSVHKEYQDNPGRM